MIGSLEFDLIWLRFGPDASGSAGCEAGEVELGSFVYFRGANGSVP